MWAIRADPTKCEKTACRGGDAATATKVWKKTKDARPVAKPKLCSVGLVYLVAGILGKSGSGTLGSNVSGALGKTRYVERGSHLHPAIDWTQPCALEIGRPSTCFSPQAGLQHGSIHVTNTCDVAFEIRDAMSKQSSLFHLGCLCFSTCIEFRMPSISKGRPQWDARCGVSVGIPWFASPAD